MGENFSQIEENVLGDYRMMFNEDQAAIRRLTSNLAEHSVALNGKTEPEPRIPDLLPSK